MNIRISKIQKSPNSFIELGLFWLFILEFKDKQHFISVAKALSNYHISRVANKIL